MMIFDVFHILYYIKSLYIIIATNIKVENNKIL